MNGVADIYDKLQTFNECDSFYSISLTLWIDNQWQFCRQLKPIRGLQLPVANSLTSFMFDVGGNYDLIFPFELCKWYRNIKSYWVLVDRWRIIMIMMSGLIFFVINRKEHNAKILSWNECIDQKPCTLLLEIVVF